MQENESRLCPKIKKGVHPAGHTLKKTQNYLYSLRRVKPRPCTSLTESMIINA